MQSEALSCYEAAEAAYRKARNARSAAARAVAAAKTMAEFEEAKAAFDKLFAVTKAAHEARRAAWAKVVEA